MVALQDATDGVPRGQGFRAVRGPERIDDDDDEDSNIFKSPKTFSTAHVFLHEH